MVKVDKVRYVFAVSFSSTVFYNMVLLIFSLYLHNTCLEFRGFAMADLGYDSSSEEEGGIPHSGTSEKKKKKRTVPYSYASKVVPATQLHDLDVPTLQVRGCCVHSLIE